jgi:hypothetical protein
LSPAFSEREMSPGGEAIEQIESVVIGPGLQELRPSAPEILRGMLEPAATRSPSAQKGVDTMVSALRTRLSKAARARWLPHLVHSAP